MINLLPSGLDPVIFNLRLIFCIGFGGGELLFVLCFLYCIITIKIISINFEDSFQSLIQDLCLSFSLDKWILFQKQLSLLFIGKLINFIIGPWSLAFLSLTFFHLFRLLFSFGFCFTFCSKDILLSKDLIFNADWCSLEVSHIDILLFVESFQENL